MLNPGGVVGSLFNKSAATRMNNNIIDATRASMPFNQAAQDSLRNQYTKKNNTGLPPVGSTGNNPLQGLEPNPVQVPTGGPRGPIDNNFDPSIFAENQLDKIVEDVKQQQFLQSPRVKDAMEAVRFKNIMNSDNPKYLKDSRSLFRQVAERIGMLRG